MRIARVRELTSDRREREREREGEAARRPSKRIINCIGVVNAIQFINRLNRRANYNARGTQRDINVITSFLLQATLCCFGPADEMMLFARRASLTRLEAKIDDGADTPVRQLQPLNLPGK